MENLFQMCTVKTVPSKVVMQGKLIAVVYTLRTYSAEFVNKNRCISVRLVSEEVKSITFL